MIVIESKRRSKETLKKLYPGATILDVTSHAEGDFVKFSPFYPHGGIPVPFSGLATSMSVEGIWQGLKVFNSSDVCMGSFRNSTMKDLKRTVRSNGPCLGHRKGVHGTELLGYLTSRKLIYLPAYKWVLDHKLGYLIDRLRKMSETGTLVLLDYETNGDVLDASKPLSHASLIKAYIEGNYPVFDGAPVDETPVESAPSPEFVKGGRVKHAKFGEGTVVDVMTEDGKIVVEFDSVGQKTLALKVAKLEKI